MNKFYNIVTKYKDDIEKTQKYIHHANNNLKSYEDISGLDLDFEKLSVKR